MHLRHDGICRMGSRRLPTSPKLFSRPHTSASRSASGGVADVRPDADAPPLYGRRRLVTTPVEYPPMSAVRDFPVQAAVLAAISSANDLGRGTDARDFAHVLYSARRVSLISLRACRRRAQFSSVFSMTHTIEFNKIQVDLESRAATVE